MILAAIAGGFEDEGTATMDTDDAASGADGADAAGAVPAELPRMASVDGFEIRLAPAKTPLGEVYGIVDYRDDRGIWEFKLAAEAQEDHLLQLLAYLALAGGGRGTLLPFTGQDLIKRFEGR